jgi:hypothetical protein
MRKALVFLLVVALAAPVVAVAAKRPQGSLSIEGGRGVVTVKGQGGVLGKVRGSVRIVDLTPTDRWRPLVNGVVVRRAVWVSGAEVSFRILGGKFKIQIRGEAVSVSARGVGQAVLKGEPDALGQTGVFATGENADCVADPSMCEPVPMEPTKVLFGPEPGVPPEPAPTTPRKAQSVPPAR